LGGGAVAPLDGRVQATGVGERAGRKRGDGGGERLALRHVDGDRLAGHRAVEDEGAAEQGNLGTIPPVADRDGHPATPRTTERQVPPDHELALPTLHSERGTRTYPEVVRRRAPVRRAEAGEFLVGERHPYGGGEGETPAAEGGRAERHLAEGHHGAVAL